MGPPLSLTFTIDPRNGISTFPDSQPVESSQRVLSFQINRKKKNMTVQMLREAKLYLGRESAKHVKERLESPKEIHETSS